VEAEGGSDAGLPGQPQDGDGQVPQGGHDPPVKDLVFRLCLFRYSAGNPNG
jgi:hypothetical protein